MAIIEEEFLELTKGLDIKSFWKKNDLCWICSTSKPRAPVSFSPDDHWLFSFLNVKDTISYYKDKTYRNRLHKEANTILNEYIGKKFFNEDTLENSPKRIENLFNCEFKYTENSTPWLVPATSKPEEFKEILDKAEKTEIEKWAITEEFKKEWELNKKNNKPLPKLGTGSRGPATIMTSVLSPETFFYWTFDYPELLIRFREILTNKMIELNKFLRKFSNNNEKGWWITDDNCALFNPELYEIYCMPVLKKVLSVFAPKKSRRYQHSDSSMAHLLDHQKRLGINAVNYGPDIDVKLIREKMKDAWIQGHTPPLLLLNGKPEEIENRIYQDFIKAGLTGRMEISTAGSLAAGTGVGRMRFFMLCVQKLCKYRVKK